MLKIQIISNKHTISSDDFKIVNSSLNSPKTFDLFDVNIISLQDENIWRYEGDRPDGLNCSNDLRSLRKLIENTKSKVIIAFPLNYNYLYYKSNVGKYYYCYYLKDQQVWVKNILEELCYEIAEYDYLYENSYTICGNSTFNSSFCFAEEYEEILTRAAGSGKPTTVKSSENCILTTLYLSMQDCNLKDFLDAIGLRDDKPDYPQWLIDFEKFDDIEQRQIIEKNQKEIETLKSEIEKSQEKLQSNLRYKSVLTENGDKLVEIIFDILEKITGCNLSDFKDEKKEDFLIKLKDCTFIGEIKGITSNVKSENVTQVDVHYQSYLEKLQEENKQENVKALLIINPLRNKPISEREVVHENQIKLAQRNGSLIIPTIDLLTIFEKFLLGVMSSENIIKQLVEQTGLIDISKIE